MHNALKSTATKSILLETYREEKRLLLQALEYEKLSNSLFVYKNQSINYKCVFKTVSMQEGTKCFAPLNKQILPYSALVALSTTSMPNTANISSYFAPYRPVDFIDRRFFEKIKDLQIQALILSVTVGEQ